MRRLLVPLAAAALLCGCPRRPAPPSEDYAEAQKRYGEALGKFPDGYERPEMDQVLALLTKVPKDSADFEVAGDLRQKILDGRARLAGDRTSRKELLAKMNAPSTLGMASGSGPSPGIVLGGGGGPAPGPAAPVDLQPKPPPMVKGPDGKMLPPIAYGTKADEFKKGYAHCFEMKAPLTVNDPKGGPQTQGEAWALKGSPECKTLYPGQKDSYVIVSDGMIVNVQPISTLKTDAKIVQPPPVPVPAPAPPAPKK
jgi:hypothetical protein